MNLLRVISEMQCGFNYILEILLQAGVFVDGLNDKWKVEVLVRAVLWARKELHPDPTRRRQVKRKIFGC